MSEKNNKFKGQAIVCYIDILGFSDDIKKHWNSSQIEPEPLKKILAIKEKTKYFVGAALGNNFDNYQPNRSVVSSISDSFIIRFGFDDKINSENTDISSELNHTMALGIINVIYIMIGIWIACITEGYTVRGAIDFGDVYWDETSIIGSAFINVYELESKVAKNSRVLISSNLNKKLKYLFENNVGDSFEKTLEELGACFRKDVDGYIIVDPSIMTRNLFSEYKDSIVKMLSDIKDKIENPIIREKYTPLISMLNDENKYRLKTMDYGNY